MLEKLKAGWGAASKLRWVIAVLAAVYVASGLLLGELTYQQAVEVFIRALGL